jgi:hypothetical protein
MSHSAHRCGTVSNLQNDYTMYARTSRYVNREGCGPKLRKILEIFLSENPVNFGSSHSGKSFAAGLDPEEYARSLDKAYAVACCFSKPSSVLNVLKRLKEADTGISIVVSGLIEEVQNMADEMAQKVRKGRLTAEEGAMALAQPCPCGIFNLDRCRELLAEQLERISKEGEE